MLNKLRLLTPGPTPLPERVRLALAQDMIHHRKDDFHKIMARVEGALQTLFGTKEVVLPLASSGTGAMTAAAYSLFKPGEKVLVVEAGKFGQRWSEITQMRGLNVVKIIVPWGEAVDPNQIADTLNQDKDIRGVFLQISETSTGVLQPIPEIAEITRNTDVLLVLDGISAIGLSPCPMDALGIDCLLTGSQKGLMLPPGLALIALSARAWERASSIEPGCFYFNLPAERKKLAKNETHFTTPVNLICGLDVSLDMLLSDGLEKVYQKQWALTMLTRYGIKAMGLEFLAPKNFTWGITSIKLPEGVDGKQVLAIAQKKFGVCMAGGQDHLKGKIVRIGHMGWVDWSDVLAGLYALDQGLFEAHGFSGSRDYLEKAMAAYQTALTVEPGQDIPEVLVRS
ncbi:MAG: alanine--glyoxylate aminotransferase family protein [Desulfovibrionaceae bacterium]|nr:alanine--glyoxylate aminotransferase family protein [Desulfovibrionaceae bacterium]